MAGVLGADGGLVIASTYTQCLALDAATGQVRWRYAVPVLGDSLSPVGPVVIGGGIVWLTSAAQFVSPLAALDERTGAPISAPDVLGTAAAICDGHLIVDEAWTPGAQPLNSLHMWDVGRRWRGNRRTGAIQRDTPLIHVDHHGQRHAQ